MLIPLLRYPRLLGYLSLIGRMHCGDRISHLTTRRPIYIANLLLRLIGLGIIQELNWKITC